MNSSYDDWIDWRDGFRDWYKDFKKIKKIDIGKRESYEEIYDKRIEMNKKQKILLRRRHAKRFKSGRS